MLGTLCKSSSFLHLCSLLRLGDGGRKPSPQTAPHLTQSTRVNNSVPMTEENTHVKNEQDLHAQCPCLSHSLCIEVLHVKDTISLPKIKVYIHTHTHTHNFQSTGNRLIQAKKDICSDDMQECFCNASEQHWICQIL